MGSWRLPAPAIKQELYYQPSSGEESAPSSDRDQGDEEEEASSMTSLMDAIPVGEAIHGE